MFGNQFVKAVIGKRCDQGEVAMRDPRFAIKRPDMVRNRAQAKINNGAVKRADIGRACMNKVAVEHHNRSGRPNRGFTAAFGSKLCHGFSIQGPKRMGSGFKIVTGFEYAGLVALGMNSNGPFAGVTSSRNRAMLNARGSGISSSRCQVP